MTDNDKQHQADMDRASAQNNVTDYARGLGEHPYEGGGLVGFVDNAIRTAVKHTPYSQAMVSRTEFDHHDLNAMIDLVEQTDPEDLESSGRALWDARDAIKAAADELKGQFHTVPWVGKAGDDFRTWGDGLVASTYQLSGFAGGAGDQITAAAEGLASVRKAMPPRDTRVNPTPAKDFPAPEKVAGNKDYAAAVQVEKHRQEAINQMNRLASYYAVSNQSLQDLHKNEPEFKDLPEVGAQAHLVRRPRSRRVRFTRFHRNGLDGSRGASRHGGAGASRKCARRNRHAGTRKRRYGPSQAPRRSRRNAYRLHRHSTAAHDHHTWAQPYSAGHWHSSHKWQPTRCVRRWWIQAPRPQWPIGSGLERHRWFPYSSVGSGARGYVRCDQSRLRTVHGARAHGPDGPRYVDRSVRSQGRRFRTEGVLPYGARGHGGTPRPAGTAAQRTTSGPTTGAGRSNGVVGGRPSATNPSSKNGSRIPRGTIIGGEDEANSRNTTGRLGQRGVFGTPESESTARPGSGATGSRARAGTSEAVTGKPTARTSAAGAERNGMTHGGAGLTRGAGHNGRPGEERKADGTPRPDYLVEDEETHLPNEPRRNVPPVIN
ncbi:hypothetical protein O1M54_14715 [Streptomyces diastatochromogenes]|nr:hypothetical protein [Streptomyces diastatochromogenes]